MTPRTCRYADSRVNVDWISGGTTAEDGAEGARIGEEGASAWPFAMGGTSVIFCMLPDQHADASNESTDPSQVKFDPALEWRLQISGDP